MVSKIELVLAGGLLFFLFLAMQTDKDFEKRQYSKNSRMKNLEMFDVSFREVNRTTLLNNIHAQRAQRYGSTWYFDNFTFQNPEVRYLRAKKASKDDKVIRMSGNVRMKKRDGTFYRADSIRYDVKKKILYSIGRFEEHRKKRVFVGYDFVNDMNSRTEEAYNVSVIYIIKNKTEKTE